jgi:hypothetical protein
MLIQHVVNNHHENYYAIHITCSWSIQLRGYHAPLDTHNWALAVIPCEPPDAFATMAISTTETAMMIWLVGSTYPSEK